jgi:hypothetical protein
VDSNRTHAHALGRRNLIAHQRQQGRNEQSRPCSRFAQEFGGNKVDKALAPTRILHHQKLTPNFHNVTNRFLLTFAKNRIWKT